MDRVLPVELEHVKLRKGFRGYVRADVDDLLRRLTSTLEDLLTENEKLREAGDRLRAEVEMLRRDSKFVQEALITAQKTADEVRTASQKTAEAIIDDARQSAATERNTAQQKVAEIRSEIDRLRDERARFIDDFRLMLERHVRDLEGTPTPTPTEKGDRAPNAGEPADS